MESCPTCRNMLQHELPHMMGRPSRLFCPTCPYVCHLESKVKRKRRKNLVKKEIERKEDMKMGCSETDATCPMCIFGRALYSQVRILSTDGPPTKVYQCLRCESRWL